MRHATLPTILAAFLCFTLHEASVFSANINNPDKPNLLIIMTDEHNLRTLGCYRDLLSNDQAFVWGNNVKVDTPHIDGLAKQGALFSNYYVTNPVCTPSRASFLSGLYPSDTGAWYNHQAFNKDVVTFAEVLEKYGYWTSYMGKWHLVCFFSVFCCYPYF